MVWNPVSPDGAQSVKANVTIQQQNTTYTENTLGNSTNTSKDHFWNIGVDEDGHHRAVQMMDYADTYTGAPASPTIATGMDLAIFARLNSSQITPFVRNSNAIMELLGIQAYAIWNYVAGNGAQTLVRSYNVTSVNRQTAATGRYEVNYTTALPSGNYGVFFGAQTNSSDSDFNSVYGSVVSGSSVASRKGVNQLIFQFRDQSGTLKDVQQGWLMVFGG
jgi:hypothetical protein